MVCSRSRPDLRNRLLNLASHGLGLRRSARKTRFFAHWRYTATFLAFLRNTHKTSTVSSVLPKGRTSFLAAWRHAAVPFALLGVVYAAHRDLPRNLPEPFRQYPGDEYHE